MKRTIFFIAILAAFSAHATPPGNNGGGQGGCGKGQQTNGCGGTAPSSNSSAGAIAVGVGVANSRSNSSSTSQVRSSIRNTNNVTATPTATSTGGAGGKASVVVGDIVVNTPAAAPAATTDGASKDTGLAKLADDLTMAPSDPRRPVSTAYAPNVVPTSSCMGGASFGMQLDRVGVSAGGANVVDFCETIEIADVAYRRKDAATGDEIMCGLTKYRAARKRANNPCHEDKQENAKRAAQADAQPTASASLNLLP